MIKIGINGFGRIGRTIFRESFNRKNLKIVAINDLIKSDYISYLLKYDSVHGKFNKDIYTNDNYLKIDNNKIYCLSEKNISNINWDDFDVDVIIESTGLFLTKDKTKDHLSNKVKLIVITGPSKDDTPMYVMGVNHNKYKGESIISNSSCTTNCIAPLAKVINDNFNIIEGLMTTVHATTSSQKSVDGLSSKDWRGGRGILQNIIPSSTGAAKAVGIVIPELNGKISGISFRVPISNVSVVDFTVRIKKSSSYNNLCNEIKNSSRTYMKNIIGYCDEDLVSTDFNNSKLTCIFDEKAGLSLNNNFFKLISWYDNETAYSNKVLDLIEYIKIFR